MDITQSLRAAENALRDLIYELLSARNPHNWESKLGISEERKQRWEERQKIEGKRQKGAPIEGRLLYYADFYDILSILDKNWSIFSDALGDKKTIEVWLNELERLRDPNAHNRELLPFQKSLISGISGDLRARILRYRNKMENSDDYFPKIESVRDSVGHSWSPGHTSLMKKITVHEEDQIEIVMSATDPLGEPLEYGYQWHPGGTPTWTTENTFIITITDKNIGRMKELHVKIRSKREIKAYGLHDDFKMFHYDVLPRRQKRTAPAT